MPLYEYQCENCGKRFEVIQKFSDDPLTVHAECGAGPVERLLSAPALQFKGSGWYITDYARAGNNAKSEGDKPEASKSESGKSESGKPEKKSDSNGATPAASGSESSKPSTKSSEPASKSS